MLRPDFASPADMALCRQMIRQGSKSFHLASLLLPSAIRGNARSLYGFCRMADDLVDAAASPQSAVDQLSSRLDQIYAGSPGDEPVDRAFADVAHRYAIPRAVLDALIEGFAWDAQNRSYQSLSDVSAYGVRVAGTVGVMMSLIMGVRNAEALARAIDLGVAMQFSNIARDVAEDARMGRVYLPSDLLAQTNCTAADVLKDPFKGAEAAMQLVDGADVIYERAASGIAMLPCSCRASINTARLLYREIGWKVRSQNHMGRAVVAMPRKLALAGKAILESFMLPEPQALDCLPEGQFLLDEVARTGPAGPTHQGVAGHADWVMQMFIAVEQRRS